MKRKVIQQGPATLMISLPSKWVKENNVKKGDEIDLNLEHNQIIITSNSVKLNKEISLHFKSKKEYLDRVLMSKYRNGFDKITITYDDSSIIELIKNTLKYLLGFEIVEQSKNSCVIQNISQHSDEEYSKMFRRMFQIMTSQSEFCFDYILDKNKSHLDSVIDLKETLVKLEQFNLRIINKNSSFTLKQKPLEYLHVWHISTFSKTWASLAKKYLYLEPELLKSEINFFKEVVDYTKLFYESYYKNDESRLLILKNKLYKLRPIGSNLLENGNNRMITYYLLRIINRMYEVTQTYENKE